MSFDLRPIDARGLRRRAGRRAHEERQEARLELLGQALLQGDQNIANQTGAATRSDLNNELQALARFSDGTSAPATTYPYQFWADTTNGLLKQRNAANSGWIIRHTLAETRAVAKSAGYTVAIGDFNQLFKCSSTFTLAFTAAATLGDGFTFEVQNTGAGVITLDPNSTEQIDGATTVTLSAGQSCRVWCDGSAFFSIGRQTAQSTVIRGAIAGLTMSTAGSSTTLTVAAGQAADSTAAVMMTLAASMGKTTSSWTAGGGNGGKMSAAALAAGWYHFYEIYRSDTGVVDVGFDTSASSPTLPTNYTHFRRIGAAKNDGTNWVKFVQDGDYFVWDVATLDVNTTNPGTSAVLATLNVPTNVNVFAQFNGQLSSSSGGNRLLFSDPAITDAAPSTSAAPLVNLSGDATTYDRAGAYTVRTNTSGQVRYRVTASDANLVVRAATTGWLDRRGRDA